MTSASTPPTSVPASCAITIATRTVALTRPSCRSPTRAWRTDTSVTSNTVTAVSPISCWPIRHAIATSGSPGGASGISRLPSAANSSDTMTTRPSPKRPTARSASSAPSSEPKPPSAATTPITAGSRRRSSVTNRSHVAPNTPHIAARPIVPQARPRSTGSRTTSRRPSRISCMTGSRSDAGGGGGSGRRIVPSRTAETTNERASMAMAIGAVSRLTRNPATPNAANSTAELVAASAPLARTRSSRPTTVGRYARSATSKNVVSTAARADTMNTCGSVSQPPIAATGMLPSSTARPRSAQMRTGRRRRRSTQAPAANPTSSAATRSRLRSTATSIGPAWSVRMATNGSAIRVTKLPNTEIVAAAHTRMNAPLRHRPGVGVTSWVGGTGSSRGSAVTARRVPAARRPSGARCPPAHDLRVRHAPRGHDVHSHRLGVARTRAPPERRQPSGLISTDSPGSCSPHVRQPQ